MINSENRATANRATARVAPTNDERTPTHVFTYPPGNLVHVYLTDGSAWFPISDVSSILFPERNPEELLSRLSDDEKQVGATLAVALINESGVYRLIFIVCAVEPVDFRRWFTSQALAKLRKPVRKKEDYIDLRSEPYSRQSMHGQMVRVIEHEGKKMYSLNDILRSIHSSTDSYRTVSRLKSQQVVVKKIWIYNNPQPAWFIARKGIELIESGTGMKKTT
jgi:prophage antirepressor-like protein